MHPKPMRKAKIFVGILAILATILLDASIVPAIQGALDETDKIYSLAEERALADHAPPRDLAMLSADS